MKQDLWNTTRSKYRPKIPFDLKAEFYLVGNINTTREKKSEHIKTAGTVCYLRGSAWDMRSRKQKNSWHGNGLFYAFWYNNILAKIRNGNIRLTLTIAIHIDDTLNDKRLKWYGHVYQMVENRGSNSTGHLPKDGIDIDPVHVGEKVYL